VHRLKRNSILLLVFCLVVACQNFPEPRQLASNSKEALAVTQPPQPDPKEIHLQQVLKQYQQFIENKVDELNLTGAAYAIVRNGEVISMHTYGKRKKYRKDTINEHTAFRMASISKSFASVLAGVLVNKGIFDWDDKVRDLAPRFRLRSSRRSKEITVRHMLSHTTGLRQYARSSVIQSGRSFNSVFRSLRYAPIETRPGKKFAYQNAMYSVISKIVKRQTDYSYEEMLDSLIFQPLGMSDASVGYRPMIRNKNKAYPHVKRRRNRWKSANIRTKWYNVNPAAGVNASVSDMAIWANAMLGHHPEIIPPSVLRTISKPHIPINEDSGYYETWGPALTRASYGLGWRIFEYNKNKIIYHGGWIRGYRPEMAVCPAEDIGIVFLTNSNKNDLSTICIPTFFQMYFAPPITS